MRLRRCHDNHAIHFTDELAIIGSQASFSQAELARWLQPLGIHLSDVQLHWHCIEVAKVIHTPAAQAQKEDFGHRKFCASQLFCSLRGDPIQWSKLWMM